MAAMKTLCMIFVKLACRVAKSKKIYIYIFWWVTGQLVAEKLPKFGLHTHTTALPPMEQSSILSVNFVVQWSARIFLC